MFEDINSLRTKWGDTIYKLANEDGTTDLKIDVGFIIDKIAQIRNVEYDVSSREFSKNAPIHLKCQADRCKVLIEGKNVINALVSHGPDICNIPVL